MPVHSREKDVRQSRSPLQKLETNSVRVSLERICPRTKKPTDSSCSYDSSIRQSFGGRLSHNLQIKRTQNKKWQRKRDKKMQSIKKNTLEVPTTTVSLSDFQKASDKNIHAKKSTDASISGSKITTATPTSTTSTPTTTYATPTTTAIDLDSSTYFTCPAPKPTTSVFNTNSTTTLTPTTRTTSYASLAPSTPHQHSDILTSDATFSPRISTSFNTSATSTYSTPFSLKSMPFNLSTPSSIFGNSSSSIPFSPNLPTRERNISKCRNSLSESPFRIPAFKRQLNVVPRYHTPCRLPRRHRMLFSASNPASYITASNPASNSTRASTFDAPASLIATSASTSAHYIPPAHISPYTPISYAPSSSSYANSTGCSASTETPLKYKPRCLINAKFSSLPAEFLGNNYKVKFVGKTKNEDIGFLFTTATTTATTTTATTTTATTTTNTTATTTTTTATTSNTSTTTSTTSNTSTINMSISVCDDVIDIVDCEESRVEINLAKSSETLQTPAGRNNYNSSLLGIRNAVNRASFPCNSKRKPHRKHMIPARRSIFGFVQSEIL